MQKPNEGPKPPPKPEKRIIPQAPKAPTIGDKAHAGRLLSEFLRRIAQEKTEFVKDDDGDDRMVSKAEAMARTMFKIALGYEETIIKSGKSGEAIETTKVVKPSAGMIALIYDRMEGRAAPTNLNEDKKRTLPKKVSAENKKRLNELAQGGNHTN